MLTKLTIKAFKDEHLRQANGTFELQVNPEKISRSYQNEYVNVRAVTGPGRVRRFTGIGESALNLEFIIDATGAIPGVTDVTGKVRELRQTASNYEGDIHSPPYLRVIWGDLNFPCRFQRMSVDYTLFAPTGVPLRAKITLSLTHHAAVDTMLLDANEHSPDLTHGRVVAAGETLPLICEAVYREDRYYPQVARFNDLDNLVSLTPGQRLSLPPLRRA